ncbi:glycosyl transferase family 2 [[Phormidium ambiguum] IAM M-71]|uniref:Glycosyl transferase family 2 n=1 Tax=[Phormidium ambiguum] IAM M-71 TaxID=454136 RepID=A0A1U7IKN9_9CYAN|nr:glycosyltransferase family 2 protein [Phormidium ambiguum]OKH37801.1 glycosyl transferase family 2 [Phormidium ambiguum IAM M-71]
MIQEQPFVSAIVPVFNDAVGLKRCLESLKNQTYPQNLYEIIVVDNGSNTEANIADIVANYPLAILTNESQPGSYSARNKGISLAKGAVIAFTDADCIPAADWLEQGVKILLANPQCGFIAGKIQTCFQEPNQPNSIELYESLWYPLPQKEFVEKHHFGATANVFTFASVIQQVGVFDSCLKSNGDREWGQRVYHAGYQPLYAEEVCVNHPARYTLKQLSSRARRIIGGRYDLQQKTETSVFKRNSIFLINVAKYAIAPIAMLGFNLFLDKRLKTPQQKIQVSLVMFFVSYLYVWEMIQLKSGKTSHRG